MSREALWDRVRMAWALLAGESHPGVGAGRDRESKSSLRGDEPPVAREGFAEEALPWLDAVYRFSLRLTRGDRDAAEDLTQETFLRAHRFWHTFERGTNAKSWLFTICRNTYLHQRERSRNRRERPEADLDGSMDIPTAGPTFTPAPDPEREFFDRLIEDAVVEAIDELPDELRDVLVLSDLGDLKYTEIADVLGIPVGTVKSRLYRARQRLQERLREFAVRARYVQEDRS